MSNIFSQLSPTVWIALVVLLIGSIAGIYVLRLVRKGAKKPADIIQATKERIDQQKARKAAVKQAEAAIAAPVASSRLSRIGARGNEPTAPDIAADQAAIEDYESDVAPGFSAVETPLSAFQNHDMVEHDVDLEEYETAVEVESDRAAEHLDDAFSADEGEAAAAAVTVDDDFDAPMDVDFLEPQLPAEAFVADEPNDAQSVEIVEAETVVEEAASEGADETVVAKDFPVDTPKPDALDLADAGNHPRDWDQLLAIVNVLDSALKRSWSEDHLAPSLRVRLAAAKTAAGENFGDCPSVRSLAQQLAATDLARTINSAAREQASEIVAAVREFAHSTDFTAQDCGAVMAALAEVEWMALIVRDNGLEKRTMPLTRHDPEAPLWVTEAQTAMRQEQQRQAA